MCVCVCECVCFLRVLGCLHFVYSLSELFHMTLGVSCGHFVLDYEGCLGFSSNGGHEYFGLYQMVGTDKGTVVFVAREAATLSLLLTCIHLTSLQAYLTLSVQF